MNGAHPGDVIYRYLPCSINGASGGPPVNVDVVAQAIERHSIRFSFPRDLNDPFECNPDIRWIHDDNKVSALLDGLIERNGADVPPAELAYIRANGKELLAEMGASEAHLEEFRSRIGAVYGTMGVCCFSSDPLNLKMWSHYAAKHQGFTLGIDKSSVYEFPATASVAPCRTRVAEIKYRIERPIVDLVENFEDPENMRKIAEAYLLTKGKEWAEESEFRMLAPHRGNLVEPILPSQILEITIGAHTGPVDAQRIRALTHRHLPHALLYRAVLPTSGYRMTRVLLD